MAALDSPTFRRLDGHRLAWALAASLLLHGLLVLRPSLPKLRHHARHGGRGGSASEAREAIEFGVVQTPVKVRADRPALPLHPGGVLVRAPVPEAPPKGEQSVPGRATRHQRAVDEGIGQGDGRDVTSLEAQRSRVLVPPLHCADLIAGTWASSQYHHNHGAWALYTLTIRRGAGDSLEGRVVGEVFYGKPEEMTPPDCEERHAVHARVTFEASGELLGRDFAFGEDKVAQWQNLCGVMSDWDLDEFTGTLDPARDELQVLQNDGDSMRDVPTLFRRVACE